MFIIAYAFIDILVASLWERSISHFWAAQPPVFMEVFIFLSRPDTSNSRVDFSTDGSSRPYRIVTILRDICSFPWLTSFLNFTTRHHVTLVFNSNWRPYSVHVYWTCLCGSINPDKTIVLTSEIHCWLLSTKACFYKFSNKDGKKTLNSNTDGLVTTDYLRAKTTDLKILLLSGATCVKWPMTVITARAKCLKKVGILTPLHTT